MGESECDYKGILIVVKPNLSSLLHLRCVCFLFEQNSSKYEYRLHSTKITDMFYLKERSDGHLNSVDLTNLPALKWLNRRAISMPNLQIEHIFSQFAFYQKNYLNIIQDPDQYYQCVSDAHIHFSVFSEEKIYLGDLLQLWFGDKWTEHQVKTLHDAKDHLWERASESWHNSLFLFSIERPGLFSSARAYAWSTEEQQIKQISIDHTFPYYCHYLSLSRPKRYS